MLTCEVCGKECKTAQGLSGHRRLKHSVVSGGSSGGDRSDQGSVSGGDRSANAGQQSERSDQWSGDQSAGAVAGAGVVGAGVVGGDQSEDLSEQQLHQRAMGALRGIVGDQSEDLSERQLLQRALVVIEGTLASGGQGSP